MKTTLSCVLLFLGLLVPFSCQKDEVELPSAVNFVPGGIAVDEKDSNGIAINISFSNPAKEVGSFIITMSSILAKYGVNYVTNPSAIDNKIKFEIGKEVSSASFTILPIHDFTVTGNLEINFTLSDFEGVMKRGANVNYTLTITDQDTPAKVNFAKVSGEVDESNADGITIELPFTSPVPGSGIIEITLTTSLFYGVHFRTEPQAINSSNIIRLPYDKNQTSKSFKVIPGNNTSCSVGINNIKFSISAVNGGALVKGEIINYDLTFNDDEANNVSFISFAESIGVISEKDVAGVEIKLNFSKPVSTQDRITVSTSQCNYLEQKFIIIPEVICEYYGSYVYLDVIKDQTNAMIKVFPVDNSTKGNFNVIFYLGGSLNGCLQPVEGSAIYSLTIVNDD